MNWSFRLVRIAGIDIKVHLTFFLILLIGAWQWGQPFGAIGAAFGVLLMILLFVCVTLHELGHSLVARAFGIPTREIILLPLGGLALLTRNPSKPVHELLIAAAGPLVNVVIAGLLFLAVGVQMSLGALDGSQILALAEAPPSLNSLLLWLLQANIALVLFNLIPAFPLDGGRMLRAILAMFLNARRATQIATLIGQGLAVALGVFGLLSGNLTLTLVAIFIFIGAGQENAQGQARTMLTTLRVGDAYNKHALTLNAGDRISKVVDFILTSYQPDYAVMQNGHPIGIVSRDDLLRGLATGQADGFVNGIMRREVVRVDARLTLDEVRERMAESSVRVVAVYAGESYLGLVSIEDIAEAFAVLTYLERQPPAGGTPRPVAATEPASPPAPPPPAAEAPPARVLVTPVPGEALPTEHERLLLAKRRRLGALELQQRFFGPRTPPEMVAEIEALQKEIAGLEAA